MTRKDNTLVSAAVPVAAPGFEREAEERLHVGARGRMELSENFWCHMGRYLHARSVVRAHAARQGRRLRVLDAASGTGYGTYLLSRGGATCDGVDLDAQAVAFSRRTFGRPRCRFTQGTVLELPFASGTFDVAVSFETIEHLPRAEQAAFVKELRRVLKPGGRLVLSAPVRQGGAEAPEHNRHHAYEPDPSELIGLVRDAFEKVQVQGQLIGSSASAPPVPETSASFEPQSGVQQPKQRVARAARHAARTLANQLLKPFYLDHPASLQAVMKALYTGHLVGSLDLQSQTATFLVLEARA